MTKCDIFSHICAGEFNYLVPNSKQSGWREVKCHTVYLYLQHQLQNARENILFSKLLINYFKKSRSTEDLVISLSLNKPVSNSVCIITHGLFKPIYFDSLTILRRIRSVNV